MRLLVIAKKSSYELYLNEHENKRVETLLENEDKSVAHLLPSHKQHTESLAALKSTLSDLGHEVDFAYRDELPDVVTGYPLIISAGGDGTVLDAASKIHAEDSALLSLNTSPDFSVGFLCALNARQLDSISTYIDAIDADSKHFQNITRLQASIDGKALRPILNDILVCHANPGASSKYRLSQTSQTDLELTPVQKNSGIWISTAAGSTAAMLSAGGSVQTLDDTRLQFRVREPYLAEHATLIQHGFFFEDDLTVLSCMRRGKLFLDGPHTVYDFKIGSRLTLSNKAPKLRLSVSPDMLNKRKSLKA